MQEADPVAAIESLRELKPLAGIGVAELGGDVAVRYCGRLFARLGATVVRAPAGEREVAAPFAAWLDQGKEIVQSADEAIAHLARAGVAHRLIVAGQTKAEIAAAEALLAPLANRPTLLAITWFDPRGVYADWSASDAIMQAMSGIAFSFGEVEGPPVLPQGAAPQVMAGLNGFIAALADTFAGKRRATRIETSVFEAAVCFCETMAIQAAAIGSRTLRLGVNRYAPCCPCNFYPTTDGYVGVTALTPPQWIALAKLVGRPDLAEDPTLSNSLLRLAVAESVDAVLAPIFATRSTDYWVERGDTLHIPITPATRPLDLPELPHWRDRGAFEPMLGGGQAPSLPFHFTFDGERKPRIAGGPAGPLQGVRIADFTMGWAGPLATRYLGDLGADVLKIESHTKPDWYRGGAVQPGVFPPPTELSLSFTAVNRSKRGLDLDLYAPDDRRITEDIVRLADIVIDNQGPGVMDKLGLGPVDQRRLNPTSISVSMPPFGRTGPLAGIRAYGSTVEEASGMPFANGRDGWGPVHQHVAYGDPVAGIYAVASVLVGLYARERLGGATVDLCQVECLFQLGAEAIIAEQAAGRPLPQTGSRREDFAPCCIVPARGEEAWLCVAVDSDEAWRALATAIGRDDLADDRALSILPGRRAREDELEVAIAAWALDRDPRAAAEALQAAGVAAGPVIPVHALMTDPHLGDSGYWARQHRAYSGEHVTPLSPFRFDGERPSLRRAAPLLGEHTDEVLTELGIQPARAAGA